jgi:hypothetical protein
MFTEMIFAEWVTIVKAEFIKASLMIPEDEALLELSYMECMEAQKSIARFVEEEKRAQKR